MRIALAFIAAWLAAAPARAAPPDLMAEVRAWRLGLEAEIVGQLVDLTRIRSVAADPAGLQVAADRLQGELARRGFETRQLAAAPGTPAVVYGALTAPGATRTVVFYAHYDGQPVAAGQWRSDPFAPVMRAGLAGPDVDWRAARAPYDPEWRLFGRAASDDKSSIVAFLAAFDALKAAGRTPSVNLKVFWEGEEEAGSPHLDVILRQNRALLAADLWLIGDAPVHQSRRRTIYFGARGNIDVEATIYGPLRALHSGHYGNWAPNPAAMAGQLIADLRDPEGGIRIPGFSSDVRPLTPAERKAISDLPPIEDALTREDSVAGPGLEHRKPYRLPVGEEHHGGAAGADQPVCEFAGVGAATLTTTARPSARRRSRCRPTGSAGGRSRWRRVGCCRGWRWAGR